MGRVAVHPSGDGNRTPQGRDLDGGRERPPDPAGSLCELDVRDPPLMLEEPRRSNKGKLLLIGMGLLIAVLFIPVGGGGRKMLPFDPDLSSRYRIENMDGKVW